MWAKNLPNRERRAARVQGDPWVRTMSRLDPSQFMCDIGFDKNAQKEVKKEARTTRQLNTLIIHHMPTLLLRPRKTCQKRVSSCHPCKTCQERVSSCHPSVHKAMARTKTRVLSDHLAAQQKLAAERRMRRGWSLMCNGHPSSYTTHTSQPTHTFCRERRQA